MHRRKRTALAGLTALTMALSACSTDGSSPADVDAAPAVELPVSATSAPAAPPSPEASASPSPDAEPSPAASPKPTYDVAKAQRQLADLGYYLGAADGRRGPALRSAVMAFQKVQGLGVDGTIGPATLKALEARASPPCAGPGRATGSRSTSPDRSSTGSRAARSSGSCRSPPATARPSSRRTAAPPAR